MSIRGVVALACVLVGCSFDGSSPPGTLRDAGPPVADAPVAAGDAAADGDAGPGCADGDGDGYMVALSEAEAEDCGAVLDCDDVEPRAFPGQREFFVMPRPSGSFDFDCDGDEEPETDEVGFACQVDWDGCVGTGWLETPPPCGGLGSFHECGAVGLSCREVDSGEAQMRCR